MTTAHENHTCTHIFDSIPLPEESVIHCPVYVEQTRLSAAFIRRVRQSMLYQLHISLRRVLVAYPDVREAFSAERAVVLIRNTGLHKHRSDPKWHYSTYIMIRKPTETEHKKHMYIHLYARSAFQQAVHDKVGIPEDGFANEIMDFSKCRLFETWQYLGPR